MHTTKGEERDVEFLVATLPGDGPRSIGVVIAGEDRTESRNDEGDRLALARDVSDANREHAMALAQAAMCHDINNVLTAIGLAATMLRRPAVAPEDKDALLREIEGGVQHVQAIMARARGRSVAEPPQERADVGDCVQRALSVVGPLARSARVALAVGSLDDAAVSLGKTALTQVLTNLLTNAIHAIQDAERPGRVDVTATRSAPNVVTVTVRDDGVGIEPSFLIDSFEAFQTTRSARGGTGLGLAIVRKIVEGAGGRVGVVSTPGSGTEMHLELPVEQAGESARSSVA
jgi:signal transduction histidine kinase